MKKLLSAFSVFLIVLNATAQSAKFSWCTNTGSTGHEISNAVFVDVAGNIFTVGSFTGTVDFNPGAPAFYLTSTSMKDIFVMKQDPSGAFIWARKYGGALDDEGTSIEIDALDNIYVTGHFRHFVDFNVALPGGDLLSTGDFDIFMLKLNRDGLFTWVKSMGGNAQDFATSNTWHNTGYMYTTGSFWAYADLIPGPTTVNFLSAGLSDVYITKMDQSGNHYWTRTFGTEGIDESTEITTDNAGNVYTIGTFTGNGDFNPTGSVFKLGTNGLKDIFISKLNSSGGFVWAKQIGGSFDDMAKGITVTDSGHIYITGSFSGKVDFNVSDLDADTFYLESKGKNDFFIAKLNPSGNFVWAKNLGADSADCLGMSVKPDMFGNIVVSGIFTDTVDFDENPAKEYMLSSAGGHDVFITKITPAGDFIWAKRFGGPLEDTTTRMFIDVANSIITTGCFRDTVDFNPAKEVAEANSNGNGDIFLHKMAYCVPSTTTINDTFCSPFTLDGVTYDKSGTYSQTITGLTGCEEFVTLNLDIRDLNDTVSLSGVVLTSHASGVKYQWIECTSKKEIPGATGKSYIALGNAKYAVTIFDGKCRDTSDCIEIASFSTSLEEYALQNSVQIFPNPSNGEFVIAVNDNMLGAKTCIYNLMGQKVRDIELKEVNTKQSLTPGFYIIDITKEQKRLTKKLLVE